MWGNALQEAWRSLFRNPLRSFLTVLGVVIGVAAVIVLVTLGRGATLAVQQQIAAMGANVLFISPSRGFGPGSATVPFRVEDALFLEREAAAIAIAAPAAVTSRTVVAGNQSTTTQVVGIGAGYLAARQWPVAEGREPTEGELRAGAAVCLLGQTVARTLFAESSPVGERVRIEKLSCEVIGVLEGKGQSAFGQDQDDLVMVPLRLYHRRIAGNTQVRMIIASVAPGYTSSEAIAEVRALLRERRHLGPKEEDDFRIVDSREIERTFTTTTQMLTTLLSAVAAISLLVGGIGIMNIMLVSVTERTREIGIRRAIGARGRDVRVQFLVEAVVLSGSGGIIGAVLAVMVSRLAAQALTFPFVLDYGIIALAVLFSAAIGVVFGFLPAHRAARLDPIAALRQE
ncbi:MAG: ABC transporter permease [Hydrogenophilus sp.]|nr:ABC transporter permease [Hydrogenophilus sp.]